MFTDRVNLILRAGRGGNGVVAWTRAKFIPKGGPCGGDGGNGGAVTITGSKDLHSLDHFRNTKLMKALNGSDGGTNNRHGKNGLDKTLLVPCGTLIKDNVTGELLLDLTEDGQSITLCKGGKGGYGNDHFKRPTNRAPKKATPGQLGVVLDVELELKLIADVGFVGLPNAGKSTLMSAITPNQVKIGNYPFTTLKPNLSYIHFDDYSRIYLADIPGIIKDAHTGRGLGIEFLRHIERSSVSVFVIDIAAEDGHNPLEDFALLKHEMVSYNQSLLDKPYVVALNKSDLPSAKENIEAFRNENPNEADNFFPISAANQEGLEPLIERMRILAQKDGKKYK